MYKNIENREKVFPILVEICILLLKSYHCLQNFITGLKNSFLQFILNHHIIVCMGKIFWNNTIMGIIYIRKQSKDSIFRDGHYMIRRNFHDGAFMRNDQQGDLY